MRVVIDLRGPFGKYRNRGIGNYWENIISTDIFRDFMKRRPDMILYKEKLSCFPVKPLWLRDHLFWPFENLIKNTGLFVSSVALGPIRDYALPYFSGARKTAAAVFDIIPLEMSELNAASKTKTWRLQSAALKKAETVFVTSEYVKESLIKRTGIAPRKIVNTGCAVDCDLKNISPVRPKSFIKEGFIMALGETANKNIARVIEAFGILKDKGYDGGLIICGRKERQSREAMEALNASSHQKDILFTGCPDAAELAGLYKECSAFVFPSLSEGFGLPVIEAMYFGAPVICSGTTSLPEASGGNAIFCDPLDSEDISEKTGIALNFGSEIEELRIKAREYAHSLSWENPASKMVEAYEKLLS